MEHRFFSKSPKKQNQTLFIVAVSTLAFLCIAAFVAWVSGMYLLGILVFSITLSIAAPFFDVPSLVKSGKLRYHSPLFLSEKPKDGVVTVHGGTLFDYVFVLDKNMGGSLRTKYILQQYLSGLLKLISELESEKDEVQTVRGTSYILNESTAKRLGFKSVKTDAMQTFILAFNYFNIMLSASLAKKRLTFPSLLETKTFEATLSELYMHKAYIQKLNEKMISTINHLQH